MLNVIISTAWLNKKGFLIEDNDGIYILFFKNKIFLKTILNPKYFVINMVIIYLLTSVNCF